MIPVPISTTFRPNEAWLARPCCWWLTRLPDRHRADPVPADGLPAGRVGWPGARRAGCEPGRTMPRRCWRRPGRARCCPQHGEGWFGRPGLSGHRLDTSGGYPAAGRDWSPLFQPVRSEHDGRRARVEAEDKTAGLRAGDRDRGGAGRRHPGPAHADQHSATQPYVVDSLEVVFPLPGRVGEVLDFTGRQTAERIPQRHRMGDGLWLREGRRGHTGHDSATVLVAGVPGFAFGSGEVYGLHVAWSGNTVHRVERVPSGLGMAGAEAAAPGRRGDAARSDHHRRRRAAAAGRDRPGRGRVVRHPVGLPRGRPVRPGRPVRAVPRLPALAARASALAAPGQPQRVGSGLLPPRLRQAGRAGRRSPPSWAWNGSSWTTAGSAGAAATGPASATGGSTRTVWPGGLHRLVDHVRGRGMQFGLWIEPEMVNPDSDLVPRAPGLDPVGRAAGAAAAAAPAGPRPDPARRSTGYLLRADQRAAGGVRRSPTSSGTATGTSSTPAAAPRGGRPGRHDQALAVYALLDELRERHPGVEWESCAAGGGRIDLGMLERVRAGLDLRHDRRAGPAVDPALDRPAGTAGVPGRARVGAVLAPDRPVHADVAALRHGPVRPPRASSADITQADQDDLAELAAWIRAVQASIAALIHSGRMVRIDTPDDTAWMHGVVAAGRVGCLMSYVQLDEPRNDQPAAMRVAGSRPARGATWSAT